MTFPRTTAVLESGIFEGGKAASALELRANVMAMTQAAEDAVLRPADCGAWSHDLRAALAARMARLNGNENLAVRYAAMAAGGEHVALAVPASEGEGALKEVLRFMDDVAMRPRDVKAADVSGLQAAGIADADIVRLTELNAFLGYQIRLIAGLKLMARSEA